MEKHNIKTVPLSYVEDLYIKQNYSMELLAQTIGFPMPILSRLLWKHGLPEKKQQYYKEIGGIPNEKKKKSEVEVSYKKDEKSLADEFFG